MTTFPSRRWWPLWVALICWLLVLSVPGTRTGFRAAWSNRAAGPSADSVTIADFNPLPAADGLLRRFPGDRRVEIYVAPRDKTEDKLAARYPNDATILSLALIRHIRSLVSNRNEGPLTNPNYPLPPPKNAGETPSSPADWHLFLALARRGQQLEPNNTYFCWLRLYGLFATRRDAEARAELRRAARLTDYDDHSHEFLLNTAAVLKLTQGSPLSPRDQSSVWNTLLFPELAKFRQTCRWAMEGVIADRAAGHHDRALNAAFDLVRLARPMRRESNTIINSLVGTACETIAAGSVTMPPRLTAPASGTPPIGPPPGLGPPPGSGPPPPILPPPPIVATPRRARPADPLSWFQSDSRMLYVYARSQKRADITRYLDKEWVEMGQWQRALRKVTAQNFLSAVTNDVYAIIAAERFAVICLRVLPSLLLLSALFAAFSRRFRDDSGAKSALWRGAWFGSGLLVLAMVYDALIVYQTNNDFFFGFADKYFGSIGLIWSLPSWVWFSMAGATLCLGLNRAVAWQKEQRSGPASLKTRLKTFFAAPEDDLARFDFGWVFSLVARSTVVLILFGGSIWLCLHLSEAQEFFDGTWVVQSLPAFACLISAGLSASAWRAMPRRRQTLRLGLRHISQLATGFLVAASVLYALVAFGALPVALRGQTQFEARLQRGELAAARAKMGM